MIFPVMEGVRQKGLKKSEETAGELLVPGDLCPHCGLAGLERTGLQVFCPLCGYGAVSCT